MRVYTRPRVGWSRFWAIRLREPHSFFVTSFRPSVWDHRSREAYLHAITYHRQRFFKSACFREYCCVLVAPQRPRDKHENVSRTCGTWRAGVCADFWTALLVENLTGRRMRHNLINEIKKSRAHLSKESDFARICDALRRNRTRGVHRLQTMSRVRGRPIFGHRKSVKYCLGETYLLPLTS